MPINDSVVGRLACSRDSDGQSFLQPHHLLAAGQLERLIRHAQLAARLTMSYDPTPAAGARRAGNGIGELADSASNARQRLNRLAQVLPSDCWNVMFDVCGLGKGLQMVEIERRWPRRSAKLVLRIGLTQLATQLGLAPAAVGVDTGRGRSWRSERLPIISAGQDLTT